MADKNIETPTSFGGFEALAANLIKQTGGNPIDDPIVDPDDVKGDKDVDKDIDKDVDVDKDIDIDKDVDKDKDVDVDIDKEVDVNKDKDITDEDFKELEPELTTMLRDELGKELDWEYGEEDKFESITDLVEYMKDVVEESSKPIYASDEIKQLNDFVANGGNLKNFLDKTTSDEIDFESIDIDSESDQKLIIKEHLRSRGVTEDRIKKSLNRYEDASILEEEAQNALELLKEYKGKERETLLENQKKQAKVFQEQQQKFYSDVESEIKGLEDIKGFKITKEEKKDLLNYIFKPTADKNTAFQKEYAEDVVRNLIESAFFVKKGKAFVANVKAKASSDAYKQIQEKLKTKRAKRNISSGGQKDSGGSNSFGSLAKTLLS